VWGGGYGGGNKTSGDPVVIGSHDLSARTAGFAGGFDYRLAPNSVVGLAVASGGTNWSLSQGLGGGRSDAFQAGVYGATRWGAAYLAADFAFTNHWTAVLPTQFVEPLICIKPALRNAVANGEWMPVTASLRDARRMSRDPAAFPRILFHPSPFIEEIDMEQILINLIAGAVGGIGVGKSSPKFDLGTAGNIISGLVGGGLLGQIATLLLPSVLAAAQSGNFSVSGIISQAVAGGAGGAILTAIVGAIKNKAAA
jgi:hypothetical protein